jgi:hypothetical protein
MTRKAKERAYQVLLYGLSEERRVCGMTDEEWTRRNKEIWRDCFGDEK